jgi:hypothetical protein
MKGTHHSRVGRALPAAVFRIAAYHAAGGARPTRGAWLDIFVFAGRR